MAVGLTPATTHAYYFFAINAYSHYSNLYGLGNKSLKAGIAALKKYAVDGASTSNFEYVNLEHIQANAFTQYTSQAFLNHFIENGIHLRVAAPKKQNQNHLAEHSWQTICGMARSLLVHAHLPDTFWFHALCYASDIFNVLPICRNAPAGDVPTTPYQLFHGTLPCISAFRVFGSPVVMKRWVTEMSKTGKQTERGTRGIFIGFPPNQKGYLIFCPGSRKILVSDDGIFDESFQTAIATTWQQFQGSLSLKPVASFIPDIDTTLEQTGTLVGEGTPVPDPETTTSTPVDTHNSIDTHNSTLEGTPDHASLQEWNSDNSADTDCEEDHSTSSTDSQLVPLESSPPEEPQPSPQIVDAGPTRRSTRTRKLPAKVQDFHLANVCLSEAYSTLDFSSSDALSWEPAPRSIRDIVKMPHASVKEAWLKSGRCQNLHP